MAPGRVVVVVCLAMGLVAGPSRAGPAAEPGQEALVFDRSVGTVRSIYAVSGDGKRLVRLTEGPDDTEPTWSPDGRWIAFLRDGDLYVMQADGTNRRRLADGGGGYSWAPDSSRLANGVIDQVDIVSLDGTTRSVEAGGLDVGPALWSPDGSGILVDSEAGLRIVDPVRGGSRVLPGTKVALGYTWSPDGRTIAFARKVGGRGIFRIGVDGTNLGLVDI